MHADPDPDDRDLRQGDRRLGAERPGLHALRLLARRAGSRCRRSPWPPCSASCPSAASRARPRWGRRPTTPAATSRARSSSRWSRPARSTSSAWSPRASASASATPASSASASPRGPLGDLGKDYIGSGFADVINFGATMSAFAAALGAATAASRILFAIARDGVPRQPRWAARRARSGAPAGALDRDPRRLARRAGRLPDQRHERRQRVLLSRHDGRAADARQLLRLQHRARSSSSTSAASAARRRRRS